MYFLRLYILFFISFSIYGQNEGAFKHLTLKYNGKTQYANRCIQDNFGNMWFSNSRGIHKYNGYDFSSIPTEQIFTKNKGSKLRSMSKDSDGNIWLVSAMGNLSKYATNGIFKQIETSNIGKISQVICLNDFVFIIANNNEIYSYSNFEFKKIIKITSIDDSSDAINSLALSKTDNLYIGSINGKLFTYSLYSKELINLKDLFINSFSISDLVLDNNDNLWIGTDRAGLMLYDTKNKKLLQNEIFNNSSYNLSNDIIYTLYKDHNGMIWEDKQSNLWVLTNFGDVNILPHQNDLIKFLSGTKNNFPQRVLSMYKSSDHVIWIGTDGHGLTKIVPQLNGSNNFKYYFKNSNKEKGFYIQSIVEDANGNMWIGTYKNGLWTINHKTNKSQRIPIKNINNLESNDVRTIFIDSKNRIWVSSDYSINIFSRDQKLLGQFEIDKHGLKGSIAESFLEDDDGNIWVGIFYGGLFKFNENLTNFNNSNFELVNIIDEKHTKYNNGVTSMAKTGDFIWIINPKGFLIKFNSKNHISKIFKDHKPFKNLYLNSIEKDKNNNLWIGTNNGIIFFNPKDSTSVKYHETDGLHNNKFLARSSFHDKNGILYFGNNEGVIYFDPLKLKKKELVSELHINNIEILNKPAERVIPEQLVNGINEIKQLNLNYNQSSFSFRFSAIGNILDPNFHYSYKLKGFDKDWISNTQNRTATYTNIPPNKYTFMVRASNEFGVWNIPSKSIKITVGKPWWKHPLLYLLNLSIILLIVYLGVQWFKIRKKTITKELVYKKENELHNLKMDFFTRMSHEIQTPLSIISAPIDDMLAKSVENGDLLLKQRLNIINNNVKRLSKIAFELTTVRNIENNQLKLRVKKNNLYDEIKTISLSFKEESRIKKIDFTTNCPKNLTNTWYDKDKVEHIIYNLLSNAFKFTPENGNIQLNIIPLKSKDSIKISIIDSGPGIPEEELKDIFTLFYQSKVGKKLKGTGIGLTLTKELIDLHRGKIEVTSNNEDGTCFTITLPIAEKNYSDSEKISNETAPEITVPINTSDKKILNSNDSIDRNKTTLLVVEDDFELRYFLKELLSDHYNILLAENGEEGLHLAKKMSPDLILSDIMMPKMDGIEMCNLLQNNSQTKHIPIILITAKNSANSKIQGLKSGAVEFINKPFNTTELRLIIKNIITSKKYITSKIKKEAICNPDIDSAKTQDEIFLENLVQEINIHIEDTNYKMDELANSLNMSYSTLHRKCHFVTGKNLVDFIRSYRLRKGAIIIANQGNTVSESAFMVGFNDPKYFSKCFKKEFGLTPLKFRKEAMKIGNNKYLKKYNLTNPA